MIIQSTWVRDTLIKIDVYNSLPAERQQAINKLYEEFKNSGYIDARTEIGPDQWARMSDKQRAKISATASRVFRIEAQIKLLLRSDCQIVADKEKEQAQKLADRVQYLTYRKRTIEEICTRRLKSKRNNTTKQEYQEIVAELTQLQ
jgi:hypothetical protein